MNTSERLDLKIPEDTKEYKQRITDLITHISKIKQVDDIYRHRYNEGVYSHEIITYIKDNICYSTGKITECNIIDVEDEYFSMIYANLTDYDQERFFNYTLSKFKVKHEYALWKNVYRQYTRKKHPNNQLVYKYLKVKKGICSIKDCTEPIHSKYLCSVHYMEEKRKSEILY